MINAYPIGIMQGRLIPSKGRGIQFFPFEEWEEEFEIASKAGLDEVDFIFDLERYEENPLWSEEGVDKIKQVIAESGIKVRYICADFFMRRPFFRVSEKDRQENIKILQKILENAKSVGAENIEIPLLDNSSLKTGEEKDILIKSLQECLPTAEKLGVSLSLETDLPPKELLSLVGIFNSPLVKITYDSGNSSSLGYDSYEEVKAYGKYISNVHIKDRVLGGSTVPLGTGNADFEKLFEGLKETEYKGSFTLQAARQEESKEVETILSYANFVKNYINKYLS
ncbi:MAG: sugar phosphate isomerase/epimerase family protein [Candidatus Staskawiczbacteria bacterium]|nr:sugar phosphate isomerase/epimerase family protein [Candidatus Staskawiczbacteria bacterium]